jgi:molybdenum cofactor cytidylyltransferase
MHGSFFTPFVQMSLSSSFKLSSLCLDTPSGNSLNLSKLMTKEKGIMISAILLGAGESKRMGLNKLSLPWGKKTILEQCLHSLLQSEVNHVIVVVSGRLKAFFPPLRDHRIKVVMNPRNKQGMSTSIRRGLLALPPKTRGILIALGDQPFLKVRTINGLIHAFARKRGEIIAPVYEGRRGHPVIFDRKYEGELSRLRGDVGAKCILEKYPEKVFQVPTKSKAVVKDIDLWEDYLENRKAQRA